MGIIYQTCKKTWKEPDSALHSQNYGFVPLWSQQLTSHNSGINPNDVYLLKNLDHAQIKYEQKVLKPMEQPPRKMTVENKKAYHS